VQFRVLQQKADSKEVKTKIKTKKIKRGKPIKGNKTTININYSSIKTSTIGCIINLIVLAVELTLLTILILHLIIYWVEEKHLVNYSRGFKAIIGTE